MQNLKELVDTKIAQLGYTNEMIANNLGMSRTGFWQALENQSLKVEKLNKLFKFLNIEPNLVFDWNQQIDTNQVNEPLTPYRNIKNYENKPGKTDITEVEFLRGQVKELTAIVAELSRKVENK